MMQTGMVIWRDFPDSFKIIVHEVYGTWCHILTPLEVSFRTIGLYLQQSTHGI